MVVLKVNRKCKIVGSNEVTLKFIESGVKEWCEGQGAQGRGNGEVSLEKTDLKTTALTDESHPEEPTNDRSPSALLEIALHGSTAGG